MCLRKVDAPSSKQSPYKAISRVLTPLTLLQGQGHQDTLLDYMDNNCNMAVRSDLDMDFDYM